MKDWVKTMTIRTSNMLRHVSQAHLKSKKADWLLALPWNQKRPQDAGAAASTTFVYGWDVELCQAWRCEEGSDDKEAAISLHKPAKHQPHTPIEAVWADGHKHQIADLTCDDYDQMKDGRAQKTSNSEIWHGEHVATELGAMCLVVLRRERVMGSGAPLLLAT